MGGMSNEREVMETLVRAAGEQSQTPRKEVELPATADIQTAYDKVFYRDKFMRSIVSTTNILIVVAAIAVLISMLLNTAGSFVGKRVSKGIVYESTAYQLGFGGFLILVIALIMGGRFPLTWQSVGIVLFLSFVSAAAFTLWTALLVLHEAGQILVFNMLIPVTGALWSYVILGEDRIFEPLYIVSILLTAVGIILVNRPEKPKQE